MGYARTLNRTPIQPQARQSGELREMDKAVVGDQCSILDSQNVTKAETMRESTMTRRDLLMANLSLMAQSCSRCSTPVFEAPIVAI